MSLKGFTVGTALLLAALAAPASAELRWHWDEPFSASEKHRLSQWVEATYAGLEARVATLPFDVHVHLRRRDNASEPVPWAHTWRENEQSVFFYVDTQFALEDFMSDWTAAHEFSHLVIPYVGESNAWFAEGLASYLQYAVMAETGAISTTEAASRRHQKLTRAHGQLSGESKALPSNVANLRAKGHYPALYWGGALYFERVDAALTARGSSLTEALAAYISCCRMQLPESLSDLVEQLDQASNATVFTSELAIMEKTPGCPARPTPRP